MKPPIYKRTTTWVDRYRLKGGLFWIENGVLREFNPKLLVEFMRDHGVNGIEEEIVLEGLRAAVIFPDKIWGGVWNDGLWKNEGAKPQSNEFIISTMGLRAAFRLHFAFDRAWLPGLRIYDDPTSAFLSRLRSENFPFDVFFELGGVAALTALCSQAEMARYQAAQNQSLMYVASIIHVLRTHKADKSAFRNGKPTVWGINKAALEVARKFFPNVSGETIKDHWENMTATASLIYAATLVEDGRLFDWLLGINDYAFNGDGCPAIINKWFAYADVVHDTIISELPLQFKTPDPLTVPAYKDCGMLAPPVRQPGVTAHPREWHPLSPGKAETILPEPPEDGVFKKIIFSDPPIVDEFTPPFSENNSPWLTW